jgi:putative transposase
VCLLPSAFLPAENPGTKPRYGLIGATFHTYKAWFGRMTILDAKKLRALEGEHNKLKPILADAMLDVWSRR